MLRCYQTKIVTDSGGRMIGAIVAAYEETEESSTYIGSYFEQLKTVPAGACWNAGINAKYLHAPHA